jgi:hypothetical protein
VRRSLSLALDLPGAPAEVFARLTGYARLGGWVPGLLSARVLVREGDIAVLELIGSDASAPLVLEVVETRPERLTFSQVDRFRGDGVSGTCELRPTAHGDEPATALELGLHFDCTVLAWPGARAAMRRRLEAVATALAQVLAREVEDTAAHGSHTAQGTAPRTILELRRDGDRLLLWLDGRRWRLEPEERT